MELTGELKDKVEKAETKEEAKKILTEVGITLDDTELDSVAGGMRFSGTSTPESGQLIVQ